MNFVNYVSAGTTLKANAFCGGLLASVSAATTATTVCCELFKYKNFTYELFVNDAT